MNVQAFTQVQPKELDASEIESWIEPKYIEDFMRDTFETPQHLFDRNMIGIQFSDVAGQWNVKGKNAAYGNSLVNMTYGTSRRNACTILQDSLNLKDGSVYDSVRKVFIRLAAFRKRLMLNTYCDELGLNYVIYFYHEKLVKEKLNHQ